MRSRTQGDRGRSGTPGVWEEVRDPGGWGEVKDPGRLGGCQGPRKVVGRSGTQEVGGEVRDPGGRGEVRDPRVWGAVGNPGQWEERSRTWDSASQPQVRSVLVLFDMPRPTALPQSISWSGLILAIADPIPCQHRRLIFQNEPPSSPDSFSGRKF